MYQGKRIQYGKLLKVISLALSQDFRVIMSVLLIRHPKMVWVCAVCVSAQTSPSNATHYFGFFKCIFKLAML